MQIKFSTQGTLDFVNNWYVLAFNTSGTGTEPYALYGSQQQNWLDYSFEIVVFQANAGSPVQAALYQFITSQAGNGVLKQPVRKLFNPQDIVVTANCNGTQTQFCVTINRNPVFTGINASPTPTASATISPSPSPTSSATSSPTASPSNAPASIWFVNWFVASPTGSPAGQVIDAPGLTGPNDTTFKQQYDVTTSFDVPWTQPLPPAVFAAPGPSSQIVGGEVLNAP